MHSHNQKYSSLLTTLLMVLLLACSSGQTTSEQEGSTSDTPTASPVSVSAPFYIGTYTGGNSTSEGIYRGRIDLATGELTLEGLAVKTDRPSFLTVSKDSRFVYAANELPDAKGKEGGRISAYSVDSNTGMLALINDIPSNGGSPCYVSMDDTESYVLAANYGSGNISMVQRNQDGSLNGELQIIAHEGSSIAERQKGPHAHYIKQNPYGPFIYAVDLGIDKVMIYKIEDNQVVPNDPPFQSLDPGAGPRHMAFHPNGKHGYVINELNSTLSVFEINSENGALNPIQTTSTLPEGYTEESFCADIHIHPNGKFLYGSNRGHDSIVVFTIDQTTGEVTIKSFADKDIDWPRNFNLTPDGRFLIAANQKGNSVVSFSIDQDTGDLTPTNSKINVGMPSCIAFY